MTSPVWATQTVITSAMLPYTANQAGTNYSETLTVQGTSISSATSGINFVGHDIVFNMGTDTLVYSTGNGSSNYGLRFGNNYNVRIVGGWLINGSATDTSGSGCTGITFATQPHDIYIGMLGNKAQSKNGHCVDSYGVGAGLYNVEIDGGEYWNLSRWYDSRCNYDGAAIRIDARTLSGNYSISIHGITIHTSPGQGIVTMAPPTTPNIIHIYNNTITGDHRNDQYTAPGGVCFSSANAFDILVRCCRSGSTIYGNTLRSGTSYGGSRGLAIEMMNPEAGYTPTTYVEIYNNDINTHEGPDNNHPKNTRSFAVMVRPAPAGETGELKWVHFYNNTVVTGGDTATSATAYGSFPIAIGISNDVIANRNIIIENNTFRAYAATNGGVTSTAILLHGYTGSVSDPENSLIMRNNRFESDYYAVKYVDYYGSVSGTLLRGDTIKLNTPLQTGYSTFFLGYGVGTQAVDNAIVDGVYEGSASDTNVNFMNGDALELAIRRTLRILVLGNNALPISGASVTAKNLYNQTVVSGTTGENGLVSGIVTYWYESWADADSMAFNPFTLIASKSGQADTALFNLAWNLYTDTLTLNLSGEAVGPQYIRGWHQ